MFGPKYIQYCPGSNSVAIQLLPHAVVVRCLSIGPTALGHAVTCLNNMCA